MATLPFLVLAFWSRAWLGRWALLPIAAVLAWTWLNPRLFVPPARTDSWASKATFGERIWLERERNRLPERYRRWPHVLNAVSALGMVGVIWGVVTLSLWPTLIGGAISIGAKLWFVDLMVRLYGEVGHTDPRYAAWLRSASEGSRRDARDGP